ncbi:MAG TPA: tetratricopeptide repeat protein [Candidatus Sulfotelmatobacter sp.]|nr:tetratricopeptide repeat protein [Candidatus Sulfotelmatobacter sp.]
MRRLVAKQLNGLASICQDRGKLKLSEVLYRLAMHSDSNWSVPWYNLGLLTKYAGRWEESLHFNRRAVELNPSDEAACWNLGIAATA